MLKTDLAHNGNAPAVEPGAFKLPAACQYLGGISEVTLRRLIHSGRIKPCRGLRHILVTRAALDKFLSE